MSESELKIVPGCDLFFHTILYGGKMEELLDSLQQGHPLMCLDGRATVSRGKPFTSGEVFVFQIQEDKQPQLITGAFFAGMRLVI